MNTMLYNKDMNKHLFISNREPYVSKQNISLLHCIFSLILNSIDDVRLSQITNSKQPLDITDKFDFVLSEIEDINFDNTEIEFVIFSKYSTQNKQIILSAYLIDNDGISLSWNSKLLPFISKKMVKSHLK